VLLIKIDNYLAELSQIIDISRIPCVLYDYLAWNKPLFEKKNKTFT